MSNTPDTDAEQFDGFDGQGGMVVMADFARRLERERDEARQQEQIHYDNFLAMQNERDEARREAELLANSLVYRGNSVAHIYDKMKAYGKSIDTLRAECDEWRIKFVKLERSAILQNAEAVGYMEKRDQWRECAEGLILYAREARSKAVSDKWEFARINTDIARFERLKEGWR